MGEGEEIGNGGGAAPAKADDASSIADQDAITLAKLGYKQECAGAAAFDPWALRPIGGPGPQRVAHSERVDRAGCGAACRR